MAPVMLSVRTICERWDVQPWTVWRAIEAGTFGPREELGRVNKQWRVPEHRVVAAWGGES